MKSYFLFFGVRGQVSSSILFRHCEHSAAIHDSIARRRPPQSLIQRHRRRPAQQARGFFNVHLERAAWALRHIALAHQGRVSEA